MKLATLCYVKKNGCTLMLHRNKKQEDIHKGFWNGLGGKLLPGESPEECVVREIKEESGLMLFSPTLKGMITFPNNCNTGVDWYIFVYTAHSFTGELIESPEGELAWVPDDQLHDLRLHDGDKIFLDWLDQERVFTAKFHYDTEDNLVDYDVSFYP